MNIGAYASPHSVKEKVSYMDPFSVAQALFSCQFPYNDFSDGDESLCH